MLVFCQNAVNFSILPDGLSQHAPTRSSSSKLLGSVITLSSKIVDWQCGLSSIRVGEASHPGPGPSPNNEPFVLPQVHKRPRSSSPATPTSSAPQAQGRWYCPVVSCPDHCQATSRGWTSFKSLRHHLDLHFTGELSGQVPLDWLQRQGYGVCCVCHLVLSSHFNGLHPRCCRALTAAVSPFRPPLVVPSSKGLPPYPTSSPLMAESGHRSLLVLETYGASASSTHLLRWWLTGMRGRGSISSPCPLSRSGGPRGAVGTTPPVKRSPSLGAVRTG